MPMAEPSSSSAWEVKHDVFLCFRGSDTRYGFTSCLHGYLRRKGVSTFMDDRDFKLGQPVEGIHKDLKASRIAVVIFSKEFAASTFCLEELVTICECIDGKTQEAVPIFYHVDPFELQNLPEGGTYRKAFDKHRQSEDPAKVGAWESAMKRVATNSGMVLPKDRDEPEFIAEFVQRILGRLKLSDCGISILAKSFIGMDKHMANMRSYLEINNSDVVRFIVIWGMSGIGKTAIAQLVYAELSDKFDGSSFLSDVSDAQNDKSLLVHLQKRLLSETLNDNQIEVLDLFKGMAQIKKKLCSVKVLVVLDNVNHFDQLKYLIGVDYPEGWLFPGSRIIITTTEKSMFHRLGSVDKKIYDVREGWTNVEALQLFCKKAFGIEYDDPPKGFEDLSKKFVEYAGNNPLAIDVMGSSLCGCQSKEVWESALENMKVPNSDIVNKLRISLKGLDRSQKGVFLDIAFFFRGENKDSLIEVLEKRGFCAPFGLKILEDKSLITIQDSKVLMHNLIQQMGREFVHRRHKNPRKRSRLCVYQDVCRAFRCRMKKINVEGISLESGGGGTKLRGKALTKLRYLRILKLKNVQCSRQFGYPPRTLIYLQWSRYPFSCLPSRFVPPQLVELHLPSSQIEGLWTGKKQKLENLRVMDLRNCKKLKKTINFTTVPKLVKLRLSGCTRLRKVNRYISDLKNLVLLDLEGCSSLETFPKDISGLTSLENLNLFGCSRLGKLPKLGTMGFLQELCVGGFDIARLPSTAQSLRKLHLLDCNLVEGAKPFDFSCFPFLESLNLSGNDFVEVLGIAQLSKLEVLSLDNCKSLRAVPHLPSNLKTLRMSNCTSLTSLQSLSQLSKLEDLVMEGCTALGKFPDPCEDCTSKSLHLNFASCGNLNANEMQVSLSWLKIYLKRQMGNEYERLGELSMVLPRSTIHWLSIHCLWKKTVAGNSFEVSLSSDWFHKNTMGFAICAVIDFPGPQPPDYGLNGSLIACTKQAQQRPTQKHLISVKINIDRAASDHLWFLYIPCNYSRSIEWWNKFSEFKFKAQFEYFGFEVKKWGFRIVDKQDVDMLCEWNISSGNVVLHRSRISRKRKRSHDDDNFLEFRLHDFWDDDDGEE